MSIESEVRAACASHGGVNEARWDYDTAKSFREFCGGTVDPGRIDEFCASHHVESMDRDHAEFYLRYLYD